MNNISCDVAVIGGGPGGLAAAIAAKKNGAQDVIVIERDFRLGGILEQCIHTGFGLKYFNEELAGPEYADRFIEIVKELGVRIMLDTMVLSIDGETRRIHAVNSTNGDFEIDAKAIVLAMGCRERTRGAIHVPGARPAGVLTAGSAQRFINVQNEMVGRKVVILGSGDIGMIMARRMTLEGAEVKAVVEISPYLNGLTRNKVQCLDDFGIPLYLGHTISNIIGQRRLEKVSVSKVDENMTIIPGTEFDIECDTLLLSVGLIPENEVSKTAGVELDKTTKGPVVDHMMQTSVEGIFASGNVVHVNDLVDNVSLESEVAGKNAAEFAKGIIDSQKKIVNVVPGRGVGYVVPQKIDLSNLKEDVKVYFRVRKPLRNVDLYAKNEGNTVSRKRKQVSNPGEMENLIIRRDKLLGEKVSVITVEVSEVGD